VTNTKTRAEVERLVAEGLAGLREHPEPLLAERFACMLGVPPSLAEASATDTATIIEVLEQLGGPDAVAVLLALDRLIVSPWARAAAPAARRLVDAGVEPSSAATELRIREGFSGELGTLGVLAVHVEVGDAHFLGTLIAQRTDNGSAHLDGGLAAALEEEQAEERFMALRGSLDGVVDLPDASDARKDAARFFAWARQLPAPTTAGLELERPLLALALAGRRDPWPNLAVVTAAESRRLREQG